VRGRIVVLAIKLRRRAIDVNLENVGTVVVPGEIMTELHLDAEIEIAINQLRPEYRSCILLRHVEGRAYEEIAEMLDLPLGTVKTYIHRARHELREALGHLRD
jgi:RNA polymerase sigma-70 factor (ECF subfamily)